MEEELVKIIENVDLDTNAKQQAITELIGNSFVGRDKFNEEKTKTKAQLDAYNSLKAEYDTFKESKMTDEEKQAEIAELRDKEYKKLKKQLNEMTAKNIFSNAGINEQSLGKEDYDSLLNSIVKEDGEETKNLANTVCNIISKQKADIEKAVKDKIIKGQTPPPAGNNNDKGSGDELENLKALYQQAVEKNDFQKRVYYTRLIQEYQNKNK